MTGLSARLLARKLRRGSSVDFATNTREADRRRQEDCGRLAAWPRRLRLPPRQARNVSNAGSFFLEARHDQGLKGDRAAVRASVFVNLFVAVFLRSHLAEQPFARIDLQPTMFGIIMASVVSIVELSPSPLRTVLVPFCGVLAI